jgi:hypothetical protein
MHRSVTSLAFALSFSGCAQPTMQPITCPSPEYEIAGDTKLHLYHEPGGLSLGQFELTNRKFSVLDLEELDGDCWVEIEVSGGPSGYFRASQLGERSISGSIQYPGGAPCRLPSELYRRSSQPNPVQPAMPSYICVPERRAAQQGAAAAERR